MTKSWCVSDCGNKTCGFNKLHCSDPEKGRNYVFMKNNMLMHCPGWKEPEKKQTAVRKKKQIRKKAAAK